MDLTPREKDKLLIFTAGLVAERRRLPVEQVRLLSDGRVYTGRQAVANKLIDELGGEEQAIAWLESEKKIAKDLQLSIATINSWELGQRFPSGRNFERLVDYTGVPPCKHFCVMADKCVPLECLLAMGRKP